MSNQRQNTLSQNFEDTISNDIGGILTEIAEAGLDQVLEEGLLKDIPLVSTVLSMYRIGTGIRERHCIKKLCLFLDEFRRGKKSVESVHQRFIMLSEDKNRLEQEIEYLLIILDRYIEYEKSKMLANAYLTYLCNKITWNEFVCFSIVIERILPYDYDELTKSKAYASRHGSYDEVFRLESMGLIFEDQSKLVSSDYMGRRYLSNSTAAKMENSDRYFKRTIFGEKFIAAVRLELDNRYFEFRRQS